MSSSASPWVSLNHCQHSSVFALVTTGVAATGSSPLPCMGFHSNGNILQYLHDSLDQQGRTVCNVCLVEEFHCLMSGSSNTQQTKILKHGSGKSGHTNTSFEPGTVQAYLRPVWMLHKAV